MSSLPPSSYTPPPDPPQPFYAGQYYGFSDPGAPPSRALARWSLGLAIVPNCITWILSIVFACMVISRSKDGRNHGRSLSIAALIIVGVWVVGLVVVLAVHSSGRADRDITGRVTEGGRASVFDLRVGDCLPELDGETRTRTVELVACEQPHRIEIYATFDLDGQYTNHDEIKRISAGGCADRFEGFVGVPPERSELTYFYYFPVDELTFDRNPRVSCLLSSAAPVAGTLRGVRR